MSSLLTTDFSINTDKSLQATFYPSDDSSKPTIFYIHGGGLIYGSRNDLPQQYLNIFHQAGYPILTVDYYLAPESQLPEILRSLQAQLTNLLENFAKLGLKDNAYVLFGRSAGAFLAMQLIRQGAKPIAFLDFYGFPNLSTKMTQPSATYLKYPSVPDATVKSLIHPHPVSSDRSDERFLLYVYARQTGRWATLLGATSLSALTAKEFAEFPPTYICQATADPDVPFMNAIQLKARLSQAILKTVTAKAHDFDRTPTTENQVIYQTVTNWLNNQIDH
jgi:acetyl esterase/lipase